MPQVTEGLRSTLQPALLNPIENRKSGLSLNHIVGCPLDCAYCVRHLFDNFSMKVPHALMSDERAVESLLAHRYFRRDRTPVQLFNRATDPFLPGVKQHTFRVLRLLAEQGLRNHVLLITRFSVTQDDADLLNTFEPLRLSLLITYSGIDDRSIEPLGWEVGAASLRTAFLASSSFRVILYWRPLIAGVNDSDEHIARAASLSNSSHATVATGLFYREEMREHYQNMGLREPYGNTARRKIFPEGMEKRVFSAFSRSGGGPFFRKTSCAVSFAHGVPDFNGHFGITELCDICPTDQVRRCSDAFRKPSNEDVARLADEANAVGIPWRVDDRAVTFDCLDEERRYFIQHSLGYQVHDRRHPHHLGRHGRADLGWDGDQHD